MDRQPTGDEYLSGNIGNMAVQIAHLLNEVKRLEGENSELRMLLAEQMSASMTKEDDNGSSDDETRSG